MFRGFILGIAVTLIAFAAGAIAVVQNGWVPARADVPTNAVERWAAHSVFTAIRRDSHGLVSPLQPTDENLVAGAKAYGTACVLCHGASDGKESDIAKGFYMPSPQFAKDGLEDDPEGETFYKIRHGIKFTPMPAFGETLTEEQNWQVALFLKHMDKLPAAADAEWKKIPSVAASGAPSVATPAPSASPANSI